MSKKYCLSLNGVNYQDTFDSIEDVHKEVAECYSDVPYYWIGEVNMSYVVEPEPCEFLEWLIESNEDLYGMEEAEEWCRELIHDNDVADLIAIKLGEIRSIIENNYTTIDFYNVENPQRYTRERYEEY